MTKNVCIVFLTSPIWKTRAPRRIGDGPEIKITVSGHLLIGPDIDHAMLQKIYGGSEDSEKRYSPAQCIGTETIVIKGNPDLTKVSSSYVERANLTMRRRMGHFTRLTNAFSKKVENLIAAANLHFMYYNYCRPNKTLTKANKGYPTTPAMAAGISDHVWSVEEIIDLENTGNE